MPEKGTSPQDSFTYVLRNRNANAHICIKLQPVIDDNLDHTCLHFVLKRLPRVYNHTHWSSLHENAKNRLASINFLQRSQQGLMCKNMPLILPHSSVATQTFFNAS